MSENARVRSRREETMAHPNEDLLRRGYAAFASGDMETLNELFDDDIVWHTPGNNALAGDYSGKEAVFGNLGQNMEMTGGTFRLEIHDLLANDDHGVVLLRARAERPDGRRLDDNTVQVWHLRGGKAVESWLHPGDASASDQFWSD
jgi:ketosteroid isomerase-like protein